jgi:hypothetical protein
VGFPFAFGRNRADGSPDRWLLVRFDSLGAVIIFITTLFALGGFVDAGLAGICITSAMSFTMGVYWTCRFWTALELDLK